MKDETLAKLLKVALVVGGVSALVPLGLAPTVNAQGIGMSELEDMLVPTPQKVERGEDLFQQNCAACHGQDGSGMSGVELADAPERTFETPDFTAGEYPYTGGPIQIYNTISFGLDDAVVDGQDADAADLPPHPTYQHLQYQSRWDLVHYVRSLGPTAQQTDPPALVDRARERAEKGVCDESIRETIADQVEPTGEEQLETGAELYAQQCASCHGDDGAGDGPAAAALQPPPRDFVGTPRDEWTNDPSALGVFNTLATGIEGTSMASYSNLSEDDRWALTHYVLEMIPEDIEVESGEEQIADACRALSAPDKPDPIPVDVAMQALVDDQVEERIIRQSEYGPVRMHPQGDSERGQDLYVENCVTCHGVAGAGREKGPYGSQPPYLYLTVDRLTPTMAGGTSEDFAERSYGGVHATLPGMSTAAMLSKQDWRDLHNYVATFEGEAEITVESPGAGDAAPGQQNEQEQQNEQGQQNQQDQQNQQGQPDEQGDQAPQPQQGQQPGADGAGEQQPNSAQ